MPQGIGEIKKGTAKRERQKICHKLSETVTQCFMTVSFGCGFFAYSWKLPAYSGAFLLTIDNFSFFAHNFSFLTYSWSFFAYSGKVRLMRTLRDCKQRSLTVSKQAPTVSKKASPVYFYVNGTKDRNCHKMSQIVVKCLIVVTFVANCRDVFVLPSPSRRPLLVFAGAEIHARGHPCRASRWKNNFFVVQILGGENLLVEKCRWNILSGLRGAKHFSVAFRIVLRILFCVFQTVFRIDLKVGSFVLLIKSYTSAEKTACRMPIFKSKNGPLEMPFKLDWVNFSTPE